MLLPSRLESTTPKSDKRCSWLDTACGFISTASAISDTESSPDRTSACSNRRRVSFASTLNTSARSFDSSDVSSGRRTKAGLGWQQENLSALDLTELHYYTIPCSCGSQACLRRFPDLGVNLIPHPAELRQLPCPRFLHFLGLASSWRSSRLFF